MSYAWGRNEKIAMTTTKTMWANHLIRFGRLAKLIAIAVAAIALLAPRYSVCADSAPKVVLNTGKAGPRSVESPTERVILRDYKFAWANLEQAMESSSTAPLSGLFVGTANAWLTDAVATRLDARAKGSRLPLPRAVLASTVDGYDVDGFSVAD